MHLSFCANFLDIFLFISGLLNDFYKIFKFALSFTVFYFDGKWVVRNIYKIIWFFLMQFKNESTCKRRLFLIVLFREVINCAKCRPMMYHVLKIPLIFSIFSFMMLLKNSEELHSKNTKNIFLLFIHSGIFQLKNVNR